MRRALSLVFALLAASEAAHADAPRVVATIMPVHSLASAVMEGVGAPELLLQGGATPHAYSLKPSDARRLQGARAIFWIGPSMEAFLEKPLKTLGRDARIVTLERAPGVARLRVREGGIWDAHDHGDDKGHGHGHGHGHDHKHGKGKAHDQETDGHVWLDPRNASAMAAAMAATLAAIDPANANRYRANAARLRAQLQSLEQDIRRRLVPVRGRPYIVFHDAYHYFERRYGLTPAGSITLDPDRAPGPRRLYEIRKRIVEGKVACVFAEPQFPPRLVRTVIEGTPARMGVLDPLGARLTPGAGAYAELQRNLAAALVACLSGR